MTQPRKGRRALLAGLGAVAAAGALSGREAQAQGTTTSDPFTPTLHTEDAWLAAPRSKHRIIMDVTTPEHLPDAIRFAGNLFTGHKTGYGVDEADVAIVMCLRHVVTAYGYADAMWAKYGKTMDPQLTPAATTNPFNSGTRMQFADLAKRGVQFMVCGTASRGLAGRIAGPDGDADAVMKELAGNLIPSSRIVPAGVVGVTHAQERGFALIYVG